MKKLFSIIILLFLFCGAVSAQETELPDAGLTPDSPFYLLELITEEIVTFFNFGDVKKAERYAALAAERLAEAQAIAGKGKPALTEKTLERYERQLSKSVARAEKAMTKNKNTEKAMDVLSKVGQATSIHLEVLAEVSEKVPQEDKGIVESAMEASIKGHKRAVEVLETKDALGKVPKEVPMPTKIPKEAQERIQQKAQKELEEEKTEQLLNINSFKEIENICLQGGGPPEHCSRAKEICEEQFGAKTANECVRASKAAFDAIELKAAPQPIAPR